MSRYQRKVAEIQTNGNECACQRISKNKIGSMDWEERRERNNGPYDVTSLFANVSKTK